MDALRHPVLLDLTQIFEFAQRSYDEFLKLAEKQFEIIKKQDNPAMCVIRQRDKTVVVHALQTVQNADGNGFRVEHVAYTVNQLRGRMRALETTEPRRVAVLERQMLAFAQGADTLVAIPEDLRVPDFIDRAGIGPVPDAE